MIFCGAASFSHLDDGNDPPPPSSPKCCKKKQSSRSKNPYSTRGLDKFSKVMSELEEKRVKIISAAAGEQGLPMVRFMNNNSDDWIPIIFKLHDSPPKQTAAKKSIKRTQSLPPASQQTAAGAAEQVRDLKKKTSFSGGVEECWGRRSKSYYWPVVMMVILLEVVTFGRVFAICCTSIWWYLAPILMSTEAIERKSQRLIKKKDYLRHASKKTLQPQPNRTPESNGKIKGSY